MDDQDSLPTPAESPWTVRTAQPPAYAPAQSARPYAYYALGLLLAANFFNYLDRQIVSIVAQSVKADLKLTDTQLAFLLGTAFAVLYGVVGIAIGRISDALSRPKLMAAGLMLWSAMTAASGLATNFAGLAGARIGVGIGEATANPCSHSLVADYFPAKNRAGAMGVYLLGTYMGGAGALLLGGLILQHWGQLCQALPVGGACKMAGWRAAFLVVGLPGLALALLIAALREPARATKTQAPPLAQLIATEFSAAVPPFTLLSLFRVGGWRAMAKNLALIAMLVAGVVLLGDWTGDWAQWIAVAIGVYSVCTWAQVLSHRDRPLFKLTFGCPTFALSLAGGALVSCVTGTVTVWAAPYAMRKLGMSPAHAGLMLGLAFAAAAALSVTLSGILTDRWARHDARAPIWMTLIALLGPIPGLAVMMLAHDPAVFVAGFFAFSLLCVGWSSGFAALVQNLVLPRMRGTAAAAASLVMILVASGIGPFWVGKVSTLTGSLTTGLVSLQILTPIAVVVLLLAARRLKHETEAARQARARAFGEDL